MRDGNAGINGNATRAGHRGAAVTTPRLGSRTAHITVLLGRKSSFPQVWHEPDNLNDVR